MGVKKRQKSQLCLLIPRYRNFSFYLFALFLLLPYHGHQANHQTLLFDDIHVDDSYEAHDDMKWVSWGDLILLLFFTLETVGRRGLLCI